MAFALRLEAAFPLFALDKVPEAEVHAERAEVLPAGRGTVRVEEQGVRKDNRDGILAGAGGGVRRRNVWN